CRSAGRTRRCRPGSRGAWWDDAAGSRPRSLRRTCPAPCVAKGASKKAVSVMGASARRRVPSSPAPTSGADERRRFRSVLGRRWAADGEGLARKVFRERLVHDVADAFGLRELEVMEIDQELDGQLDLEFLQFC